MSSITSFQTVLVGDNSKVVASLIPMLSALGLKYHQARFSDCGYGQLSAQQKGFVVLCPSPYQLGALSYLSSWMELAKQLEWPVLLLSSLAVFPATRNDWPEQDVEFADTDLANAFVQAEKLVAQSEQHIILRAGIPLYLDGDDFASRFLSGVRQQQNWNLDNQQTFNPTCSSNLAEAIVAMLQQANCATELWGLYHYVDVEPVSAFQFAQALLDQVRHYEDIPEVVISAVEDQGERPRLWVPAGVCTKIFHVFGIRPKSWRQGLARMCRAKPQS